MKRFSRALLLAFGLAVSFGAPSALFADELPLEKSSSGTWSVEYAGQHFRVVSTAAVKVRFEMVSPAQIKVAIVSESGQSGRVSVYWIEFSKFVYNGQIPTSLPWEGTLNTEGGFIDR
jgi:hypothetical protein